MGLLRKMKKSVRQELPPEYADAEVPVIGEPSVKIGILIPTHDSVPAMFMYSAMSMALYTGAILPDNVTVGVTMQKGTYVHVARQELLLFAIEQGLDYVLWLDSDMVFPRDMLQRLIAHNKQVVGINYSKRGMPIDYVAIKKLSTDKDSPSIRLETTKDSTGLEEVDALGFGAVLMRLDEELIAALPNPDEEQVFGFEYLSDGRRQWMGEDVLFCRHLNRAGIPIYVDHDLSLECAHVGEWQYKLQSVGPFKDTVQSIAEAEGIDVNRVVMG